MKEIAQETSVGAATARRWTKELREQEKQWRDERILTLGDEGITHREIVEEVCDLLRRHPRINVYLYDEVYFAGRRCLPGDFLSDILSDAATGSSTSGG